ncbi:MAG: hypothetical protein IPH11_15640 [Ignavibacteriales bacterium]|nr:hypothetical protein [Ignavibacteriales bacterium]
MKTDSLMALNNLLGFGNPDAKYIFCIIEEGGIWDLNKDDDKSLLDFYKRDKKNIIQMKI